MTSILSSLAQKRPLVLLSELGALIHDLGKLSKEFLENPGCHSYVLRRLYSGVHPYMPGNDNTKKAVLKKIEALRQNGGTPNEIKEKLNQLACEINEKPDVDLCQPVEGKPWLLAKARQIRDCFTSGTKERKFWRDSVEEELEKICEQWEEEKKISLALDQLATELNHHQWEQLLQIKNIVKVNMKRIADFIDLHHDILFKWLDIPYPELIRLVRAADRGCDAVDSAVDKGIVHDKGRQVNGFYIATAFGYETSKIDTDDLADVRNCFQKRLVPILWGIRKRKKNAINVNNWAAYFLDEPNGVRAVTKDAFKKALGETRRSCNDVTLWDHSYSVASLYKSALAKILIENKWTEPENIKWRILRVNLDVLGIVSKAHRIGDILGYWKATQKALDEVKRLVEIEYPLGNEIYRDETGIYFTCPDLDHKTLNKLIGEIEPEIAATVQKVEKEFSPVIAVSCEGQRFLTMIVDEKKEAEKALAQPVLSQAIHNWQLAWQIPDIGDEENYRQYLKTHIHYADFCFSDKRDKRPICDRSNCLLNPEAREPKYHPPIDVCPICRLRPKCVQQELCRDCFERREARAKEWLKNPKSTIWLAEVGDHNDRVALIVGQLDLTGWLNGTHTDTLFSQLLSYHNTHYMNLVNDLTSELKSNNQNSALLWKLAREAYKGERPLEFYLKRRDDCDISKLGTAAETDERKKAKLLALWLFRKQPSPARLRRIWETAQNFWDEEIENRTLVNHKYGEDKFGDKAPRLDLRRKRLALIPGTKLDLPSLAYDATISNLPIGLYYDTDKNRFIVIENLQIVAERFGVKEVKENEERPVFEALKQVFHGKKVLLELPRGVRGERREISFTIDRVEEPADFQDYLPFVRILATPVTFLAIVPAWDAFELCQKIRKAYEDQFSKVRNRLPLNLNLVFFHHRTPLHAAIDTARRMISEQKTVKGETWEVSSKTNGINEVKLSLLPVGRGRKAEYSWQVSTKTGDGSYDGFYPNFVVLEGNGQPPLSSRETYFEVPTSENNQWEIKCLLHVTELQTGDKVEVYPSHFDFVFLDTTARRFEVPLDPEKRKRHHPLFGLDRSPRPYYLEDMERFETLWKKLRELSSNKKLTQTRLQAIRTLLATKFEFWGLDKVSSNDDPRWEEWQNLVETTLKRDLELDGKDCDFIKQTILDGLFFDCLELELQIMKKKLVGKSEMEAGK